LARFLALDWDHQQLHLVAGTAGGGTVRLEKTLHLGEEKSPNPADAETLGRRLREHLKAAGIKPAPLLACVGRDRIILKDVHYPKVAAAEEPALVRFQTVKELTDPPDEIVLDYTPVGEASPAGENRALAFVIRRELLTAYQTLCQAAGVKLQALAPRTLGLLASQQPAADGATAAAQGTAVLALGARWAELVVGQGDTPFFSRSLVNGPGLPGEVKRSLAVYGGQWPRHPVHLLHLANSGEHAALAERLQELLGIPVQSFDPLASFPAAEQPASGRGSFAGAVGLLHAQAQRRPLGVNFVRPKQPTAQKNPNRARLIAAGVAAAALLLSAIGYGYAQIVKKDNQIELLQVEKMGLDRQLVEIEEDAKRIKALEEWTQGEIVWLDELYDLTDRITDTNNLRLVQLMARPLTVPATGKGKNSPRYVAQVSLKGITGDDYQVVDTLISELVTDGHYRVEPKQVKRNTGVERFRFREEFTTKLDLEKRPPTAYVRRLSAAEADKGRTGRRGSEGADFGGFGGGQP
jgi:Tfp pilus assembly PilM family ATPase